jgi:hypothetical protein
VPIGWDVPRMDSRKPKTATRKLKRYILAPRVENARGQQIRRLQLARMEGIAGLDSRSKRLA